jgi:hypothetical protein
MNILVLLYSGFAGAINPLKARGILNINPIINPCIDQCTKERQLIPIANPISVRLAIICNATGRGRPPGALEASPKQTKPKSTPERVAIIIRFVLCIVSSFLIINIDKLVKRSLKESLAFFAKGP